MYGNRHFFVAPAQHDNGGFGAKAAVATAEAECPLSLG